MTTLTLRNIKGAPLTYAELDANFTALAAAQLDKSANLGDVVNAASALANLGGIPLSQKGQASGVATLGVDGKVPSEQLPAVSSGDFVKVQTITITNGASFVDVSLDPAIYRSMRVVVESVYGNTSSSSLMLQFLQNNLTPYTGAHYKYTEIRAGIATPVAAAGQTAAAPSSQWGNSASFNVHAEINLPLSSSSSNNPRLSWESSCAWVDRKTIGVAGLHGSWATISGLRLSPSAGTFTAGTITVYGVKK